MAEKGVIAYFEMKPVHKAFLSEQAGRPIYEEELHITVITSRNQEAHRLATEHDKEVYAEEYARFEKGMKGREQIAGTLLRDWSALTAAQVKEMEAINIFTVEQLAELPDSGSFMGSRELKAKAKAWLETQKGSADVMRYAAENERMRDEIADLKAQIEALANRIDDDGEGEEAPRRRGRKPMRDMALNSNAA